MGFAADLLRGHVSGSARHFARVKPLVVVVDRQTEVGHMSIAVSVQQHVGRFQVPVYQARGMGVLDRRGDLQHDLPHAVETKFVGLQFLLQRVALDVLENDEDAAVFLTPHVVHAHNGRVLFQTGDVTSLLHESLDCLVASKAVSAPDFDGHVPLQFLIASTIDGAEAPVSQNGRHLVSADLFNMFRRDTRLCVGTLPRLRLRLGQPGVPLGTGAMFRGGVQQT